MARRFISFLVRQSGVISRRTMPAVGGRDARRAGASSGASFAEVQVGAPEGFLHAPVCETYGFTSLPKSGEVFIALPVSTGDFVVAPIAHARQAPALQEDEVAVWSAHGQTLRMHADGTMSLTTGPIALLVRKDGVFVRNGTGGPLYPIAVHGDQAGGNPIVATGGLK